jgi:hypothetical protein
VLTLRTAAVCIAAFAAAASPAGAGPNFFVGVDEDGPATLTATDAFVDDLGVKGLRVPVYWWRGQTALAGWQVQELDEAVRATPAGGRIMLAVLGATNEAPLDDASRDQYCSFAKDILGRYTTINDIVIWNEPNLTTFWSPQFNADGTSASPRAYFELLSHCYDVLHAARPGVNVIAPATSPRGNDNPNAVSNISHSPLRFIRLMGEAYKASGRTHRVLDTVAQHVYGSTPGERPWRKHTGNQISQGDWDRLMHAYNVGFQGTAQAIPGECVPGGCVWIWYTEAGYQTRVDEARTSGYSGTETVAAIPDYAGGEPESPAPLSTSIAPDQWTQIRDGVRLAFCQPYVQSFWNYLLVDHSPLNHWQSGFLWADRTPKDSYPAFKQVIAETQAQAYDCATLKGGPPPAPDATPPAAPTELQATAGDGRVSLDWPDASEVDVMAYEVYRAAAPGGPYTSVGATAMSSYVDTGLANGTPGYYVVGAVDTVENAGPLSNEACATPRPLREYHRPTGYSIVSGAVYQGRGELSRLYNNDGSRLELAASSLNGRFVSDWEARMQLPACHSPVKRLQVDYEGNVSTSGVSLSLLAWHWQRSAWAVVYGPRSAATSDRLIVWATTDPGYVSDQGVVALKVQSSRSGKFNVRADWVRFVVDY